MQKLGRKEQRLSLAAMRVEGQIKLSPTSEGVLVVLDDISPSGVCMAIPGQVTAELDQILLDLVRASRMERFVPVQLVLNNIRIPVSIVNAYDGNRFGVCISNNEKLAALAVRGRVVFTELFQAAANAGAPEAPPLVPLLLGREFLPKGVRNFVEDETFGSLLISTLAEQLAVAVPSLKDKNVEGPAEYMKLAALCQKFLEAAGKDVVLMIGAEICSLMEGEGAALDALLSKAVQKICSEGRLFADERQRAAFETTLEKGYFKNRLPAKFSDLPVGHPYIFLINTRFANYGHEQNFFLTLPPFLTDYYFSSFIPRESEMAKTFAFDKSRLKDTLHRWVHSALNQIHVDVDRTIATEIENQFKQTMYEYLQAKKLTTITPGDITRLIDGKGLTGAVANIRAKFLQYACGVVDAAVQKRFKKHMEEQRKHAYVPEDPRVIEARKIAGMPPLDLLLHKLWGKVVELGLTNNTLNKEVARTFVPKDKSASILELGGMIVFNQSGFDELKKTFASKLNDENIADCFDKIDFKKHFEVSMNPEAKKKEAALGQYLNSLQPPVLREAVLEKVVNSPEWGNCYVLTKPKSFFEKTFADGGPDWRGQIEKTMLTSTPEVHHT